MVSVPILDVTTWISTKSAGEIANNKGPTTRVEEKPLDLSLEAYYAMPVLTQDVMDTFAHERATLRNRWNAEMS